MSKPIPVFGFAFIAFALTSRERREALPKRTTSHDQIRGQIHVIVDPPQSEGAEASRFEAAWRIAPPDRRGFTVCVRVLQTAKAPGFRLLTGPDADPNNFEYVWLGEIEETSQGFVGRAREPLGPLGGILCTQRIGFALPNIAHWALAPVATAQIRRVDRTRSAQSAELANPTREASRP